SCSTGSGYDSKENIANMLARVFTQAIVWAPTVPTHLRQLVFGEGNQLIDVSYYDGYEVTHRAVGNKAPRHDRLEPLSSPEPLELVPAPQPTGAGRSTDQNSPAPAADAKMAVSWDLYKVVRERVESFRKKASEKQLKIEFVVDPGDYSVSGPVGFGVYAY